MAESPSAHEQPVDSEGNAAAAARRVLPTPVRWGSRLLLALIVLSALTTVLVTIDRHALIDAWSAGHPVDSAIKQPQFVPVAFVLFVVFAGLLGVFIPLFRDAHNWARWSLVATVAFVFLATIAGLRTSPPVAFVLCAVAALVLSVAILVCLLHPRTNEWLRSATRAEI